VIVNVQFFRFFGLLADLDDGMPTQIVPPRPANAPICFFAFKISERSDFTTNIVNYQVLCMKSINRVLKQTTLRLDV
jgi:hypothetical protein